MECVTLHKCQQRSQSKGMNTYGNIHVIMSPDDVWVFVCLCIR